MNNQRVIKRLAAFSNSNSPLIKQGFWWRCRLMVLCAAALSPPNFQENDNCLTFIRAFLGQKFRFSA
ncbi:MAG: hypothetical protein LBQ52_10755 [Helicobacteraceae bacterium]|nr:hypothetical protein [Helicobacteraceae bacterium]